MLLRLSVAYWLLMTASLANFSLWQQLASAAMALAIGAGLQVRILSSLCVLFALERVFGSTSIPAGLPAILNASALGMIGPGAFSIDARLFGRQTVTFPLNSDRA